MLFLRTASVRQKKKGYKELVLDKETPLDGLLALGIFVAEN